MIYVEINNDRIEIYPVILEKLEHKLNNYIKLVIQNDGVLTDDDATELANLALQYIIPLCTTLRNTWDSIP